MKTTCLINNFNYRRYLVEAVESALNQTVSFDEIIIVDDCSTDDSVSIIRENFASFPTVRLIAKEINEGQLSCFNTGSNAATGDVIFFLDADDRYDERYLEEALKCYHENKETDFLFCAHRKFQDAEGVVSPYRCSRDLGFSVILALYAKAWIGSVTSTVSMRRWVLDLIMPIPNEEDWRTRADDCLVWGSSVAGARKYYLEKPLVEYRVHGSNSYFGRSHGMGIRYRRKLATNRLFNFLRNRMNYDSGLIEYAHAEFRTIKRPNFKELRAYWSLILSASDLQTGKFRMLATILIHYLKHNSKKAGCR